MGRQAASTKIGGKRVHVVRVRGGNLKFRALRLDAGNFSWSSESCTKKARIIKVVYNSTNNELVRTNTLVKGCIVEIDAAPFRQWYEAHYALPLGRKGKKVVQESGSTAEDPFNKARSNHAARKIQDRKETAPVEQGLEEQFAAGRILARLSSRPGQSGRADGVILEGKVCLSINIQELDFYQRKLRASKHK